MKAIYKKHFKKIALVWLGYLMLPLLVYISALVPQKKNIKNIEKQISEKKQIYDSALRATKQETKTRLNKELEEFQKKLGNFVINFEDTADFTFDISQIAGEKKVGDFSIKTKDKNGVTAVPNCSQICESQFDISFTADFNKFETLLNAIERNRPVVFVDKFAISRSKKDDLEHLVTMNLNVFVKKKQEI